MTEHQYLVQNQYDGLPRDVADARSTPPAPPSSTAAYADLTTPYTTVSSFTQPAVCESNLLTPVSGAGSPPLHQRTKLIRPYPSTTPNPQQHTPPASSKMYWSQFSEMTAPPSQSGSPMMAHPSVSEEHFGINYITATDDTHEHPIKEDIQDPPPEPYFGQYGVSAPPESEDVVDVSHHMHAYYMGQYSSMGQVNPSALMVQHGIHHRPLAPAPQAPILSHPDPEHFRGQQGRRGSGEDTQMVDMHPSLLQYSVPNGSSHMSHMPHNAARVTKRSRNRGRQKSVLSSSNADLGKSTTSPKKSNHAFISQREETPEPLQLKDSIPDDDRFLFESRMKHNVNRGKGMWDNITAEYNKKFGGESAKEALQMKYTRGKTKWVIWSQQDENALRKAYHDLESERYKLLLEKFKENGGGRAIDFNTTNIEAKLVELGLEEHYMEPGSKLRKRKKPERQISATTSKEGAAAHKSRRYSQDSSQDPFSEDNRDEVLDQIISERGYRYESDSPTQSEHLEATLQEQLTRISSDHSINKQQSARIAKQACDDFQRVSQHKNAQTYVTKANGRQLS